MSVTKRLPEFIRSHYEVYEWRHASAILEHGFTAEWHDILDVLTAFRLRREWIEVGGGRKSQVSDYIDRFLTDRGWEEKQFQTAVVVHVWKCLLAVHEKTGQCGGTKPMYMNRTGPPIRTIRKATLLS